MGDLVAVEPVDGAPGLLRVDQAHVQIARVIDRVLNRLLGDLLAPGGADHVAAHIVGGHARKLSEVLLHRSLHLSGLLGNLNTHSVVTAAATLQELNLCLANRDAVIRQDRLHL